MMQQVNMELAKTFSFLDMRKTLTSVWYIWSYLLHLCLFLMRLCCNSDKIPNVTV